jgi:PEP-CTERM motif
MKQAAAVLFALGMLTTVAPSAAAAPIIYIDSSYFAGTGVLHAPGTLADGLNVYLGAVKITGDLGTFWSYCVDLQHYDLAGANEVTVASMSDWDNKASPAPVVNTLGGGAASWLYNQYGATAVGGTQAALQLAIWNVLYDNDASVSTTGGGFWMSVTQSNASYAAAADAMLADYFSKGKPVANDIWLRTTNVGGNYAQDFIAPVPEPATLLLLGTGIAGMFGVRGRRRRETKAD